MKKHKLKLVEPPNPKRRKKAKTIQPLNTSLEITDILNDFNFRDKIALSQCSVAFPEFGIEPGDAVLIAKNDVPKSDDIISVEIFSDGNYLGGTLRLHKQPLRLVANEATNRSEIISGVVKYIIRRAEVQR